jgi:hypothetical protein
VVTVKSEGQKHRRGTEGLTHCDQNVGTAGTPVGRRAENTRRPDSRRDEHTPDVASGWYMAS